MTNAYFCPVDLTIDGCSPTKDEQLLTMDLMCNRCDDIEGVCGHRSALGMDDIDDDDEDFNAWCDCYTLQLTPDHLTGKLHSDYCQQSLDWKPSMVIDCSQCTCYKPLGDDYTTYNVPITELPYVNVIYTGLNEDGYQDIVTKEELISNWFVIDDLIKWREDTETDNDYNSKDYCLSEKDIVYLSNEDFLYGTYRITECGRYVLTEDIILNFNKPSIEFNYDSGDSPNTYNLDNLYWFPTNEQQESGQYFGLNDFWGPYSIGFMAGITIETNKVTLDLNGYKISMDYEFYLQQRFFAIIELANKQFESKQGPVDFGRDDLCSSNIIIKNGKLGLSSNT